MAPQLPASELCALIRDALGPATPPGMPDADFAAGSPTANCGEVRIARVLRSAEQD